MKLKPIERVSGISPEDFQRHYLNPKIPVVLTDIADSWAAKDKWTWDFLRDNYGHLKVPLYSKDYHKPGKGYMAPATHMKLGDYLTLIQSEPTDYRMFLYNIFEHAPELVNDFNMPNVMGGFMDKFPFMFFGGAGSYVNLHYDIDYSCVFHTHFQTQKECILFDNDQRVHLYNHPFTVQSHVDVLNPDYEKFPALKNAEGYRTVLEHGETLFMPMGCWHFMHYVVGGYSLSLRANASLFTRALGLMNISRHFVVDKGMNKIMGSRWKAMKEEIAVKRAERTLEKV